MGHPPFIRVPRDYLGHPPAGPHITMPRLPQTQKGLTVIQACVGKAGTFAHTRARFIAARSTAPSFAKGTLQDLSC